MARIGSPTALPRLRIQCIWCLVLGLCVAWCMSLVLVRWSGFSQPHTVLVSGDSGKSWSQTPPTPMYLAWDNRLSGFPLSFHFPRVGTYSGAFWPARPDSRPNDGNASARASSWMSITEQGQTVVSVSEEIYRIGFPFESHMYRVRSVVSGSGQLPFDRSGLLRIPRVLFIPSFEVPIRPLPIGLAGNTLIWGLVAWVFWHIAFARRDRFRDKRLQHRIQQGLCVRCGYSVGRLGVCPECGQPREEASP